MHNPLYRVRYQRTGLSFCSNDYLGLSYHPQIIAAFKKSAEKYGVGSGASQLLGGYTDAHQALEEELADFLGYERVLLFSSGYMANLGAITSLIKKSDCVYTHRLNHASLIDACRYSGAKIKRYHAVEKIKDADFIVSDGVFSMDGNLAPIKELLSAGKNLIIDDSHGIGVLGQQGRGIIEHCKVEVPILTGSFGKAFGTFGGFVASKKEIIEKLIQSARTAIYTTALPPAVVEATRASLQLIKAEGWRREELKNLITYFKQHTEQLELKFLNSFTSIQPILTGSAEQTMKIFHTLKELGFFVGAVRPPTVPQNKSRLRISLNATHKKEEIDSLLEKLASLLKKS